MQKKRLFSAARVERVLGKNYAAFLEQYDALPGARNSYATPSKRELDTIKKLKAGIITRSQASSILGLKNAWQLNTIVKRIGWHLIAGVA